ncbi:MAG: hypothetical protein RMM30_11450 [Armatimonadota bacterium]|nr:hypothetical protein [Armatimonadota bacterium]MDW8157186.1 hypothetical protein [Armatimonadota bacterium]
MAECAATDNLGGAVRRAAPALYGTKQGGRNRVVAAEESKA